MLHACLSISSTQFASLISLVGIAISYNLSCHGIKHCKLLYIYIFSILRDTKRVSYSFSFCFQSMGSNFIGEATSCGEADGSETTIEIKLKTLDSQIYTLRVDKQVNIFTFS